MNLLPQSYTRGNKNVGVFTHTQVARDDLKALYKVEYSASGIPSHLVSYELFRVRQQKETDMVMGGTSVHLEAKECLPGDNAFGKWAWSYNGATEEQALDKYRNLETNT